MPYHTIDSMNCAWKMMLTSMGYDKKITQAAYAELSVQTIFIIVMF